jgi:hypothetical protein
MSREETAKAVLSEYKRRARENRPDWDAFIDEAQDDPLGIVYEVLETASNMSIYLEWDDVTEITEEWVNGLHESDE